MNGNENALLLAGVVLALALFIIRRAIRERYQRGEPPTLTAMEAEPPPQSAQPIPVDPFPLVDPELQRQHHMRRQADQETMARRMELLERHPEADVVERIMTGQLWIGETRQQLFDSFGPAADVDESVTRTKNIEVWKYRQITKNRFGLRVRLENGIVVSWEKND